MRGKGQPGGKMGWEPPREEQALETREMLESCESRQSLARSAAVPASPMSDARGGVVVLCCDGGVGACDGGVLQSFKKD